MLDRAGIRLDPARREVFRDGRHVALSRKEFAVLAELLRADGAVVSAEQLLEKVWDEHIDPFTNVVRVTMMKLRRKLGDPPVIETVPGSGVPDPMTRSDATGRSGSGSPLLYGGLFLVGGRGPARRHLRAGDGGACRSRRGVEPTRSADDALRPRPPGGQSVRDGNADRAAVRAGEVAGNEATAEGRARTSLLTQGGIALVVVGAVGARRSAG